MQRTLGNFITRTPKYLSSRNRNFCFSSSSSRLEPFLKSVRTGFLGTPYILEKKCKYVPLNRHLLHCCSTALGFGFTEMSSTRKSRSPPSALLPNGSLNVDLITREISRDLADHAKYRAEDDMKKRAVHTSTCAMNA